MWCLMGTVLRPGRSKATFDEALEVWGDALDQVKGYRRENSCINALQFRRLVSGTHGPPVAIRPAHNAENHLLQQWFELSDSAMQECLFGARMFREFAKLTTHVSRRKDDKKTLQARAALHGQRACHGRTGHPMRWRMKRTER